MTSGLTVNFQFLSVPSMNKYISQAKYTNQLHQIVYRMATLRIIPMSSLFECKYALVKRVHIDYKVNYRSRM